MYNFYASKKTSKVITPSQLGILYCKKHCNEIPLSSLRLHVYTACNVIHMMLRTIMDLSSHDTNIDVTSSIKYL